MAKADFDLNPASSLNSANLGLNYINVGKLDEARAIAGLPPSRQADSPGTHVNLYLIAYLSKDSAGMAKEVAWSAGKPGIEGIFLSAQFGSAASSGHLIQARELTRRAVNSSLRADEEELAATYEFAQASVEARFGNSAEAKQHVAAGLQLANSRDPQALAAIASAIAGD